MCDDGEDIIVAIADWTDAFTQKNYVSHTWMIKHNDLNDEEDMVNFIALLVYTVY